MGRLTLEEINGHSQTGRRVWIHDNHGRRTRLLRLLCMDNHNQKIDPAVSDMQKTIIRLVDQLRLLDQDMIRLQEKVNAVLKLKDEEETIKRRNTTRKK